jgi:carboxypeptidase D
MGFWKNFVDTFGIHDYKVYLTGESYAGQYCSYIADEMLKTNDTKYFNASGVLLYDPAISRPQIQEHIPVVAFVDYWKGLHPFNDTFNTHIHDVSKRCGYTDYLEKYLVYPPAGQQPAKLPGTDERGQMVTGCRVLFDHIMDASLALNPCWNMYQVSVTCPLPWDVLGFPGSKVYTPEGAKVYFNRPEVKTAINAPVTKSWFLCSPGVFVTPDQSPPASISVLPAVIDRTRNVIIAHGSLDFVLIANGTLLAIQNMTWGGKMGFQSKPTEPFYVPYHRRSGYTAMAGAGVAGTVHTERGLTYVGVTISGHMVPQNAPAAAFRNVEFLLGRIASMSETEQFTINPFPQPSDPLGMGTAPQGWSDRNESVPIKGIL